MGRLSGKVALVTGGSSGIGLASAKAFAAEGASVVITGRAPSALDEAVAAIGHGASAIVGDVRRVSHHDEVAAELRRRFGGLDIYMANAGCITITPSAEVSEASFDDQFETNTRGIFFGVQRIAPIVREGGAILLTGSLASDKMLDGHAVYAGSKAALLAFARSWVSEFAPRKIRVNVLSPGPTETAIVGKLGVPAEQRPAFLAAMAGAIPAGRMGRPEELAEAALFLASDAGSFVNGVNLRVDGGMGAI
jgi:NAD(P)-dependent dehydrogenase (short-subunit alcohol dehydrogenase family)